MADAIAIISLALQLPETIKQIKTLYNQVRDAPEDIRDILEDIELHSLVLEDVKQSLYDQSITVGSVKDAVERCVALCENCNNDLLRLVQEFESSPPRKRITSAFKVVWKKDKIASLQSRLERVTSTLSIANQCYYNAMSRLYWCGEARNHRRQRQEMKQLTIMVEALTKIPPKIPIEDLQIFKQASARVSDFTESRDDGTDKSKRASSIPDDTDHVRLRWRWPLNCSWKWLLGSLDYRETAQFETFKDGTRQHWEASRESYLTLQGPSWLLTKRLQVRVLRSSLGWQYRLQTTYLKPDDSSVFHFCKIGDVEGLRALFAAGDASPFDVATSSGFTTLHYAVRNGQLEVVKLLLHCGADIESVIHAELPYEPFGPAEAPLTMLLDLGNIVIGQLSKRISGQFTVHELQDMLRLLVGKCGNTPGAWASATPPASSSWLFPNSTDMLSEPAEPLWTALFLTRLGAIELVPVARSHPQLRNVIFQADTAGRTLLHFIISRCFLCYELLVPGKWCELILKVLTLGSDVSAMRTGGRTPLLEIIGFASLFYRTSMYGRRAIRICAARWLELLRKAGKDLCSHVEPEQKLWTRDSLRSIPGDDIRSIEFKSRQLRKRKIFWVEIEWEKPGTGPYDWKHNLKCLKGLCDARESDSDGFRTYDDRRGLDIEDFKCLFAESNDVTLSTDGLVRWRTAAEAELMSSRASLSSGGNVIC